MGNCISGIEDFRDDMIESHTITCQKCKSIEDTFNDNENPEDYGWVLYKKKWHCPICKNLLTKIN